MKIKAMHGGEDHVLGCLPDHHPGEYTFGWRSLVQCCVPVFVPFVACCSLINKDFQRDDSLTTSSICACLCPLSVICYPLDPIVSTTARAQIEGLVF